MREKKSLRKNDTCKAVMIFVYLLSTALTAGSAAGTLLIAREGCYTESLESFQKSALERELRSDIETLHYRFLNLKDDGYFDESVPEQRKQALYQSFISNYQEENTNFFFAVYDADDTLLLHSYSAEYQNSYTQLFEDSIEEESEQMMSESEYEYFSEHFDYENGSSFYADQIVVPRGNPAPTMEDEENPEESVTEPVIAPATEPPMEEPPLTEVPVSGLVAHAEENIADGISAEEQIEIIQALDLNYGFIEEEIWIYLPDGRMTFSDYFQMFINQIPAFDIIRQNGRHYVIDRHSEAPELISVAEYIYRYPEEFGVSGYDTPSDEDTAEYCDIWYDVHIHTVETYVSHYITGYLKAPLTAEDNYYQIQKYSSTAYQYRYALPVLGACSAVVFLISLLYLVSSAGYHTGEETARESVFEKIPYDVFTVFLAGSAILLLYAADISIRDTIFGVILGGAILLTWSMLLLWWLMSTATRIRTKTILQNNLLIKLAKWSFQVLRKGRRKISAVLGILPMVWKVGALTCGFVFLDILSVIGIADRNPFGVFLKIVLWGATIIGVMVLVYELRLLEKGVQRLADGNLDDKIPEAKLFGAFRRHAQNLNSLGEGMNKAVSDRLKSEMFRTELIANVSHDIRTPLTSIINYTDLLSRLDLKDPTAVEYIDVLRRQSARLRKLTEDVLEASKATTGSMKVEKEIVDLKVLLQQLEGEYAERFESRNLMFISSIAEESLPVLADGRLLWRALDNLFSNICKYAMEHTRVYLNAGTENMQIRMTLRNISAVQLNIDADTLMERFVRGDRSRNTEGSGLGLSIAQSFLRLQGGDMQLHIDGDLFKISITFPLIQREP